MTSSRNRPSATSAPSARAALTRHLRIIGRGERLERGSTAFEVQHSHTVHEHDVCAGGALQRSPVRLTAARPRQRGAVRVCRVRRRQDMNGTRGQRVGRLAYGPQPVEGARQGELRGTEPIDEVAAPDPAGILHRAEDRVDGAEATLDALGRDGLAGQDAVALEEREALRVEPFGRVRRRDLGRDEGPAPGRLGWPECRQAAPATVPPRPARRSASSAARAAAQTCRS